MICALFAADGFHPGLSKRHSVKYGHVGSSPRDADLWPDYTQVFIADVVRQSKVVDPQLMLLLDSLNR